MTAQSETEITPPEPEPEPATEDAEAGPYPHSLDQEIAFEDAAWAMTRRGGTVCLPLGESRSGKTTLFSETWTDLLRAGAVGGYTFAGSLTSLAFERRAFDSRAIAGPFPSETLRTYEYDDGLLHLSVADGEREIHDLLIADVAGEHAQRIRTGSPVLDEFPWLARVDRLLVLLDGASLVDPARSENAVNSVRRVLRAVLDIGLLTPPRTCLVLTKDDVVAASGKDVTEQLGSLTDLARTLDPGASLIRTAARPANHTDPQGLDEVLDWLVAPPPVAPTVGTPSSLGPFA